MAKFNPEDRKERDKKMLNRYKEVENYAQVGREFGLSSDRARDIIIGKFRRERFEKEKEELLRSHFQWGTLFDKNAGLDIDYTDLSVRTKNGVKRKGVKTLKDLLDLFRSGEMDTIKNLGRKSIQECIDLLKYYGAEVK